MEYIKLPVFETTCLNCGKIFPSPRLSDFDYGSGIFSCKCGKAFVHHTFLSHPVTMIFDLLCHIYKLVNKEDIWKFSAFFAENINGHIFVKEKICPQCLSTNLSISTNKLSIWDIPIASYNEFYSLSKDKLFKAFEKFLSNPDQNFCNKLDKYN